MIPLYCLAFMSETARLDYYTTPSRQLAVPYAKSLVPALLLGFLLPTLTVYLPDDDRDFRMKQALAASWQMTSLVVDLMLHFLQRYFGVSEAPAHTKRQIDTPKLLRSTSTGCTASAL